MEAELSPSAIRLLYGQGTTLPTAATTTPSGTGPSPARRGPASGACADGRRRAPGSRRATTIQAGHAATRTTAMQRPRRPASRSARLSEYSGRPPALADHEQAVERGRGPPQRARLRRPGGPNARARQYPTSSTTPTTAAPPTTVKREPDECPGSGRPCSDRMNQYPGQARHAPGTGEHRRADGRDAERGAGRRRGGGVRRARAGMGAGGCGRAECTPAPHVARQGQAASASGPGRRSGSESEGALGAAEPGWAEPGWGQGFNWTLPTPTPMSFHPGRRRRPAVPRRGGAVGRRRGRRRLRLPADRAGAHRGLSCWPASPSGRTRWGW